MISEDLHDVAGLSEVMAVLGKGVNDGVQLLVVNVPIFLSGMEFMVEEEKRVPAIVIFLFKYAGIGLVGRIGGKPDGFSRLESADVNVIADVGEDTVEGRLVFGSPLPRLILLGEIGKTCRSIGIVGYEFVIEPYHA